MEGFPERFSVSLVTALVGMTNQIVHSLGLGAGKVSLDHREIAEALRGAYRDVEHIKIYQEQPRISVGKLAGVLTFWLCRSRFLSIDADCSRPGDTGRLQCLVVLTTIFDAMIGIRPKPAIMAQTIELIETRHANPYMLGLLFEVFADQTKAPAGSEMLERIR